MADIGALGHLYSAELDRTPVDEHWLRENCTKQFGNIYQFSNDCGGLRVHFLPHINEFVALFMNSEYDNPTRGLIRTLIRVTNEQKL